MDSSPPLKRLLSDLTLTLTLTPPSPPPPQALKHEDRGLRLIQLLLTCAAHSSSLNLRRADACLHQITALSSESGDSMQHLAARFATSLAVRLVKHWPGLYKSLNQVLKRTEPDPARLIFARAFPHLNFAYTIINRAILRAMSTERVVHLIDLGSGDPNLWDPLLRANSQAPRGPPHLKITCFNTSKHVLNNLGSELSELAEVLYIPFQFNPLNVGFRELTLGMLKVTTGDALAITSILNLHVLLAEDEHVATHFGVGGVRSFMNGFLDMI